MDMIKMKNSDWILLFTAIIALITLIYNIYDNKKQKEVTVEQLEKMNKKIESQQQQTKASIEMKKLELTNSFATSFCQIVNDLNFFRNSRIAFYETEGISEIINSEIKRLYNLDKPLNDYYNKEQIEKINKLEKRKYFNTEDKSTSDHDLLESFYTNQSYFVAIAKTIIFTKSTSCSYSFVEKISDLLENAFKQLSKIKEKYKPPKEVCSKVGYGIVYGMTMVEYQNIDEENINEYREFLKEIKNVIDGLVLSVDMIESEMLNSLEVMCFNTSLNMFQQEQLHDLIALPFTSIVTAFYPRLSVAIKSAKEKNFKLYSNISAVNDKLVSEIERRNGKANDAKDNYENTITDVIKTNIDLIDKTK